MKAKALEIRDKGTFIPALAVDMNPYGHDDHLVIGGTQPPISGFEAQRYLLRRVGYPCDGCPNIILTRLSGDGEATNDPYQWGGRTWPNAHHWIIEHWDELKDGDVVDVEFILGESRAPKVSERYTVDDPL